MFAIDAVTQLLPATLLTSCINNEKLPAYWRASFCGLLQVMYVEGYGGGMAEHAALKTAVSWSRVMTTEDDASTLVKRHLSPTMSKPRSALDRQASLSNHRRKATLMKTAKLQREQSLKKNRLSLATSSPLRDGSFASPDRGGSATVPPTIEKKRAILEKLKAVMLRALGQHPQGKVDAAAVEKSKEVLRTIRNRRFLETVLTSRTGGAFAMLDDDGGLKKTYDWHTVVLLVLNYFVRDKDQKSKVKSNELTLAMLKLMRALLQLNIVNIEFIPYVLPMLMHLLHYEQYSASEMRGLARRATVLSTSLDDSRRLECYERCKVEVIEILKWWVQATSNLRLQMVIAAFKECCRLELDVGMLEHTINYLATMLFTETIFPWGHEPLACFDHIITQMPKVLERLNGSLLLKGFQLLFIYQGYCRCSLVDVERCR